jgi:hypothetical protein
LAHRQHVTAFVRLLRPAQRFYLRAVITATRARDGWSLKIAVRPFELEKLLQLGQCGPVAEVGTGTGWCASSSPDAVSKCSRAIESSRHSGALFVADALDVLGLEGTTHGSLFV